MRRVQIYVDPNRYTDWREWAIDLIKQMNTESGSRVRDFPPVDETKTSDAKIKMVSDAQAKSWTDHVALTHSSDPHGIDQVDETDTDVTKNKMVSNILAKGWEAKSKIIWNDSSVRALDLTANNAVGWTDLDLTASTSANAVAVILNLSLSHSVVGNHLGVRKNGTTPSYYAHVYNQVISGWITNIVIVGMDSGQIIEWYCSVVNAGRIVIDVLGYIE